MKIFLDSNVIIAAFAARGACAELVRECIDKHSVYVSEQVLREVSKALAKKIKLPTQIVEEIISFLKDNFFVVKPQPLPVSICRDKTDIAILGAAVRAEVKLLVTGDKDLLVRKSFKEVMIVTPAEFWKHL